MRYPPLVINVTPEVRAALARHDVTTAYRLLIESGVPQRAIAAATGQSQSEVSEIRAGRKVFSVWVLERIADGLVVERSVMGLGWGATGRYDEPGEEVDEEVKRRNFINAIAGAVVWGHPVLRDLLTEPDMAATTPLPSRLGAHDVTALRDLTAQMRLLARQYGGQADAIGTAASNYTRLLTVGGTDEVKRDLGSALADLHTLAGWTSYDAGLAEHSRQYFTRALQIAGQADDGYAMAYAARHAGITLSERGAPNDGLKLFQLGQAKLGELRRDESHRTEVGFLRVESAGAFARMGRSADAQIELARARDGWAPPDVFDAADMDRTAAWINIELGNLDTAEAFARSSLAAWAGQADKRDAVEPQVDLAFIQLQAREPGAMPLARSAIDTVAELDSRRARQMLAPLGGALAARRDSTAQDLARRVRELQAT